MVDLLGLENLIAAPDTSEEPNPYIDNGRQIIRVVSKQTIRSKGCRCLFDDRLLRNGHDLARFRDQEHGDRETWLEVKVQKFRCASCKTVVREDLPDIYKADEKKRGHHITKRFMHRLLRDSVRMPFHLAAEANRVDESLIYRVFNEGANERLMGYVPKLPPCIGVDENHILKGRRFIITDLETGVLLDIQPDRRLDYLEPYLARLPGREDVRVVCQDMWRPYRTLTREYFPNAVTVVDKFHVVRMANDAVELVRKALYIKLSVEERKWLKRRNRLFDARWDKCKPEIRTKLDDILPRYPLLEEAYFLKEEFYNIYDLNEGLGDRARPAAEAALNRWLDEMPAHMKRPFRKLTTAISNWRPDIMRYFQYPVTNNGTERVNGIIKAMNASAAGMNYATLRKKALMKHGDFGFRDYVHRTPMQRKPRAPVDTRRRYRRIEPGTIRWVPINPLLYRMFPWGWVAPKSPEAQALVDRMVQEAINRARS